MATSFGALCTDFYINQKLALKLDLPKNRETILGFFDRMKRSLPEMNRLRRYEGELALESTRRDARYKWLALCKNSIRAGHVNMETMEESYEFHKLVLELCPHFLTISEIDIDHLEVMFGFDIECEGNHDEIIYNALYAGSPLAGLLEHGNQGDILDVQPTLSSTLSERGDVQVTYEIKSRQKSRRGSSRAYRDQPLSVFLTMRQFGPIDDIRSLPKLFGDLTGYAEKLAMDKLVPQIIQPLMQHISTSSDGDFGMSGGAFN